MPAGRAGRIWRICGTEDVPPRIATRTGRRFPDDPPAICAAPKVVVEVRWSGVERPAKTLRRRQHLGMATATEVTDSVADLVDCLEGTGLPGLRVKNPGQSFDEGIRRG